MTKSTVVLLAAKVSNSSVLAEADGKCQDLISRPLIRRNVVQIRFYAQSDAAGSPRLFRGSGREDSSSFLLSY